MSLPVFTAIIRAVKPFTDYLYFHVKGEPLLHPELGEMLDCCAEHGFKVNLTTNGTLIGAVGLQLLEKPALRAIHFSLHSFEGTGVASLSQDEYLREIIEFTRKAVGERELIISLRFWNLDPTSPDTALQAKNRDILAIIEKAFAVPGQIVEAVVPGKGIKLAPNLYLNFDHQFRWPDLADPGETERGFCHALRNQVAILVDGTVVPCCLDGEGIIALGNVLEQDFGRIISGDRARKLYEGFTRKVAVEPLCRKCRYKERFG